MRARVHGDGDPTTDDDVIRVRISYAIGRRVGSAVVRNRLKRRLRAVVAQVHEGPGGPVPPGDYPLVADPELVDTTPDELRARAGDVITAVTTGDERS